MSKKSTGSKNDTVTIDLQPLLTPIAVILGSLIISLSIFISFQTADFAVNTSDGGNDRQAVTTTTAPAPSGGGEAADNSATVSIDDDAILGDRNSAKVAVVEFSDYNCSFCTRHHQQTFDQIADNFVSTGEVITVYRDFPGVGGDTTAQAANAAECVRAQTDDATFFSLIKEMYNSSGTRNAELVRDLAADIGGVDLNELDSCIENGAFLEEVNADRSDATSVGINGTPGFVVGVLQDDGTVDGQIVSGAQPYSEFQRIIEEELARAN